MHCVLFHDSLCRLIKFASDLHQWKLCLCSLPHKKPNYSLWLFFFSAIATAYFFSAIAYWYSAEMFLDKSNCQIIFWLIFPSVKIWRFVENMYLKSVTQIHFWWHRKCKPGNEWDSLAKTLRFWTREFFKFMKLISTYSEYFTMWL